MKVSALRASYPLHEQNKIELTPIDVDAIRLP
jgi:hypothetical protein